MFKEAPRFIYSWKKVISSTSPSTLAHKDPRRVLGRTHQRNPCWGSPSHPLLGVTVAPRGHALVISDDERDGFSYKRRAGFWRLNHPSAAGSVASSPLRPKEKERLKVTNGSACEDQKASPMFLLTEPQRTRRLPAIRSLHSKTILAAK